jgi:hypothetical protein
MTLLVRDAADVIDAQLAFHLNAGVDSVVAIDDQSQDGTRDVLEAYAREGCLCLVPAPNEPFHQSSWVTRLARLAATELGADWVINADCDEFWWPRGCNLKEVLESVPEHHGVVQALWRTFVPRPDDELFFAERMTVRLSSSAPINDPTNPYCSPYGPDVKVAHRADPRVRVSNGNHRLIDSPLTPVPGGYLIEVLHFPWREFAQYERKAEESLSNHMARIASYRRIGGARGRGRIREEYASVVVDDRALERGLAEGSLELDFRLRDLLRTLRRRRNGALPGFTLPTGDPPVEFPPATPGQSASYAVAVAGLGERTAVQLHRRLDEAGMRTALVVARRRTGRLASLGANPVKKESD